MFKRSVDTDKFIQFLVALVKKIDGRPVSLLMDQLSVHRSNRVKTWLNEKELDFLYNACYYPDGNGIEYIFSKVKGAFRKFRIKAIVNDEK